MSTGSNQTTLIQCLGCEKQKPHKARGMCSGCYRKWWAQKNPEADRAIKKRTYEKHKEADNARGRAYYRANRERLIAQQKARDALRVEERKAYNKQWAAKNRDQRREYHRNYRASDMPGAVRMRAKGPEYTRKSRNKDVAKTRMRHRLHQQKRRARSQNDVDLDLIAFLDEDLCAICGMELIGPIEIDHIHPLLREGPHEEFNLRRLHAHCNRAKGAKTDDEMTHQITYRCAKKTLKLLKAVYPDYPI